MIAYLLDVIDVTIKGFIGVSILIVVSVLVFWLRWEWGRKDKG